MRWHCGPTNHIYHFFPNLHTLLQEPRAFIFRSILSHEILVPPSTYSPSPGHHLNLAPEEHFSHVMFRYTCSCSVLSNNCYMFFIIKYCSCRVFLFHVCRYLFRNLTTPSGICSTLACNYSLCKSIASPSHTL
jgi:hypothetical protein